MKFVDATVLSLDTGILCSRGQLNFSMRDERILEGVDKNAEEDYLE